MNQNQIEIYKFRLTLLLKNLHSFDSGADIHRLGNIRNGAQLLLLSLDDIDDIDDDKCASIVSSLETQALDFLKKKFGFL